MVIRYGEDYAKAQRDDLFLGFVSSVLCYSIHLTITLSQYQKTAFLMSVLCVVMLIQIFRIQTVQEAIQALQKAAYVKDMNS